jgi:tetratricopeptide (TPR) repeat protein
MLGVFIMQQLSLTQNVITLFIFVMFFSACQSTVVKIPFSKDLLYDQGFSEVSIQSEQHVFYLDATANAFVAATLDKIEHKNAQIEALVRAIFDRSELNLLYQGDANTNANDTFHSQTANCLSLSIMAYALASEAGFNTYFQEIIIPEYWTRRAGFSLLNRHINIKILAPKQAGILVLDNRSYQVDFAPQLLRYQSPKKVVSKRAVLSMFYNNKGIDAFLRQDYVTAYAYFREALTVNPNFDSAWVNLGILYRLSQYFPQAEKAYQHDCARKFSLLIYVYWT